MADEFSSVFGPDGKPSPPRRNPVGPPKLPRQAIARSIGKFLRSTREQRRMSQGQLALATEGQPVTVSRTTISSIERGVQLPSLDSLVALSRVLHLDPMELIERIDLASSAPDARGLSPEEVRELGNEAFWRGDYRDALAHYDLALKRLETSGSDEPDGAWLAARLNLSRAVALRRCSALIAAKSAIERAIELSEPWKDLQADAFVVLATLYYHQDQLTLAEVAIDQAARRSQESPPGIRARVWFERGQIKLCSGANMDARASFLEAKKLAVEADDRYHLVQIEGNLGVCAMALGQHSDAHKRFVKAIELAREHPAPAKEAYWLVELGKVESVLGCTKESTACAVSALEIARPLDDLLTVFRAEVLLLKLTRKAEPARDVSQRLGFLRKLHERVKQHSAYEEVRDFPRMLRDNKEGHADA